MSEHLAAALVLVGVVFVTIGTIGVARFDDLYLRLHAASKSVTFGLCFFVLAAGVHANDPVTLGKAVIVVLFQFLTSPIAALMIARAALRRGVRPGATDGWPPRGEPGQAP